MKDVRRVEKPQNSKADNEDRTGYGPPKACTRPLRTETSLPLLSIPWSRPNPNPFLCTHGSPTVRAKLGALLQLGTTLLTKRQPYASVIHLSRLTLLLLHLLNFFNPVFGVFSVHDAVFEDAWTLSLWGVLRVYTNSASSGFETYIEIAASRIVI